MDIHKILTDLRKEREQLDAVIESMTRLGMGRGLQRGRPPSWMSAVASARKRGRPLGSKNKKPLKSNSSETLG